jgi:phosphomannomutase
LTKKYKFVVDFSTGAGVTFEQQFLQQLREKHDIIFINDYPDGTFSAHESDTSTNVNYTQLIQAVKKS